MLHEITIHNNYEIIDKNGTIHSGNEEDMRLAYDVMTNPDKYDKQEIDFWSAKWTGDLKLIKVLNVYR